MSRRLDDLEKKIAEAREQVVRSDKETDTGRLRRKYYLHSQIYNYFDNGELRGLMVLMGINPEDVEGQTLRERVLNFVLYVERHGKHGELLEQLARLRPSVDWTE